MVTFPVDDVAPVVDPLPLTEPFPDALTAGGLPVVEPDGVHPLLSAVSRAFAEHRPLVLSPDAVWLTIAQGVAQHIRLHAEELRPRLVGHHGRERLTVDYLDERMPVDSASWQHFVARLGKQLGADDLFECDFTTSTEVERMAGRIVMLDAYSPYFAYWLIFVCGIPSITLTGTVGDWRKIRARVDTLPELGLETWCRSLVPIADQFVRAAGGDVDTAFWRRIHNPVDAYGGEVITGWIARLYPYLERDGVVSTPNPLLDLPVDEPRDVTGDDIVGIRSDHVPAALSRVVVNVNDGTDVRAVALHAGLAGVTQLDDGALCPVAGWHLSPATVEIEDVIDRIVRDHVTTPPESRSLRVLVQCADLVALYDRVGSATLFDGSWRLRPGQDARTIVLDDGDLITPVFDLSDGTTLCAVDSDTRVTHWITGHLDENHRLSDDPRDVPVYGTSLAHLLNAALDSGGDIGHLKTGTLDRL
ncbi:MAG: DUF4419 domain-containing protein [Actinomycetota bacterium]|nr:DUF4419 domain-containing protein [Actinomycetota bacterium]